MPSIVLIAHNIRSSHNIGSLLRTADGLGVSKVYLTGYSPYPKARQDSRLPYVAERVHRQISKTALGAEFTQDWEHREDIVELIKRLKLDSVSIAALEQAPNSTKLPSFKPVRDMALIVGREVEGIEPEILALADIVLEIPMAGKKESFNVAVAAAIALYHLAFARNLKQG